jgi:amino acid transporter
VYRLQSGFLAGMMQSFTSIGPLLDVAAVFSVIAVFSGIYLPVVMFLSFVLGYSTIFTLWGLSTRFISNGGYFAYVGKLLGKKAGLFAALIYMSYSIMVVPDISLFEGGFLKSAFVLGGSGFQFPEAMLAFAFAVSPILFTLLGIRKGLRYTVLAGFIEIGCILFLSAAFLHGETLSAAPFKVTSSGIYYIWTGLVFGILAFSGSGSSVFISGNVQSPGKAIPRGILSSYTISGIIMVISAYSLIIFLGNGGLQLYETTPYYIGIAVASRFGVYSAYALIAVVAFSGFNLCTSYLNAFLNAAETAGEGNFFGKRARISMKRNHYLIPVLGATVLSIFVASIYAGFFTLFVIIAGAVSLSYIGVHLTLNFAVARNFRLMGFRMVTVAIISSIAMAAALYYSVTSNMSSYPATNYIVLAVVASAAISTAFLHMNPSYYGEISMKVKEEEFRA